MHVYKHGGFLSIFLQCNSQWQFMYIELQVLHWPQFKVRSQIYYISVCISLWFWLIPKKSLFKNLFPLLLCTWLPLTKQKKFSFLSFIQCHSQTKPTSFYQYALHCILVILYRTLVYISLIHVKRRLNK